MQKGGDMAGTTLEHKIERGILEELANMAEFRSGNWTQHTLRMRKFGKILLYELMKNHKEFNLLEHDVMEMGDAVGLHDIGKIMIAERILLKPGELTGEEFEEMKRHTLYGAQMVERVMNRLGLDMNDNKRQYYREVYNITRWHHERFDGSGYPDCLSGNQIPICAQVAGIVDVLDSLIDTRRYRDAYTFDEALDMISNNECGEFNPVLIDCLFATKDKLMDVIIQFM